MLELLKGENIAYVVSLSCYSLCYLLFKNLLPYKVALCKKKKKKKERKEKEKVEGSNYLNNVSGEFE